VLLKGPYFDDAFRPYDVSLDGTRFLVLKADQSAAQPAGPSLVIVENWTEELKRLLPRP
jgi:hypothetical protein